MKPRAPLPSWYQRDAGTMVLRLRLTPKSASDRIDGVATLSDGTEVLKARVRAVPQNGEANRALIRLMAKSLGIATSDIHLESGDTARVKILVLTGATTVLAARLAVLAGFDPAEPL